jgi:hypothetical protein
MRAFRLLCTSLAACTDATAVVSPAEVAPELTPAACLSGSPVDLSVDLAAPPPSFYVNDLRLGYSRGEAVFLSRPLCEEYGEPLCRFVEAHEHAHHYTKTVGHKSSCAETLADCWAAAHADRDAVDAALLFFRSLRGSGGYHGEPSARAEVIAHCFERRQKHREQRLAVSSEVASIEAASIEPASIEPTDIDAAPLDASVSPGERGAGGEPELAGVHAVARGAAPQVRPHPERPFRTWARARR